MDARVVPLITTKMGKQDFVYGEFYITALKNPGERGNAGDNLLSKLEVILQVKKAMKEDKENVHLSEEDWKLLRDSCNALPWLSVEEEIRDFLLVVREAKKITLTDPKPAKSANEEK